MNRFFLRAIGATAIVAFLLAVLSCARDQELVAVSIVPSEQGFLGPDPALTVQLRALGTYVHPSVTKDITDKVVWASNTPDLVSVTPTGLLSPAGNLACGGALVSATVTTNSNAGGRSSTGALVTGYTSVTIDNLVVQGCPGFQGTASQPTLTVDFSGPGTGTVGSNPSGLSCSSACSGNFQLDSTVTLTATPTGSSTTVTWAAGSCDSNPSPTTCTVGMTGNRTVTVIFQ